jgi:hypothetical protein
MKNNLPYFTHDNDAYDHAKHRALRARFGWEGYGRFWALNELIAQAEGCQLDIQRPINRAKVADEMGLSDSDFTDFVAFLADPEVCGLVNMLDGILTTDRTQEDFAKVDAKRQRDREHIQKQRKDSHGRVVSEKNNVAGDNQEIAGDATAEQSREEQRRKEQSSNGAAARLLFPVQEIKNRIAFSPLDVTLDDAAAEHVAQVLQVAGCEDLAYLDWALERVHTRANGKPINNPAGYLLSVVALPDWISAWRQESAMRQAIRKPDASTPPQESAEPDNPAAVERLLDELPWKPTGRRKDMPTAPATG